MSAGTVKIGIIGGSGLNKPEVLGVVGGQDRKVTTPYGDPSDLILEGTIEGVQVALLARHGRQHSIQPSDINYRANIWALKQLGCTHVLVSSACGILQEHVKPGEFVIIDQFIDRTQRREQTFYDGKPGSPAGICHMPMATPFCPRTRQILVDVCQQLGLTAHPKGTAVTIEGPRFSTKAESHLFRAWGCDVIGMTLVPEVVLAKELGLCYATVAMGTDYDCWKEDEEHVDVEAVMKVFKANAARVVQLFQAAIPRIAAQDWTHTLAENQKLVTSNTMLPH